MPTKRKTNPAPSINKCPCGKTLKNKPAWIACDLCNQWWHGSCVNLTKQILGIFKEKKLPFKCPQCIVTNLEKSESTIFSAKPVVGPAIEESNSVKNNEEKLLKTDLIPETNVRTLKNLVIIDGLRQPEKFKNSRDIKAEVKKHKGNLKIKYAHALNRGGIAVALDSEEEIDILKDKWPVEAFGNSGLSLSIHENSVSLPKCILKNIPPFLSIDSVLSEISKQTGLKVTGRRLRYRDSNKPMPIVVVSCQSFEDLQSLFRANLCIGNRKTVIKSYVNKTAVPLRCYNCQEFGHIAKFCKNESKCENCAHHHSGACSSDKCCVNCGGGHCSSSTNYAVYISIRERLISRKLRE